MTTHRRVAALLASSALLAGSAFLAPSAIAAPSAPLGAGISSATPQESGGARVIVDNAGLVETWYRDFLGRSANGDAGAQYWINRLDVQAPADVLWAITHSREFNTNIIEYYYGAAFERGLDSGANYWIEGTTAQRFPLEWVLQNVLASPEYQRATGGGGAYLVRAWFSDVLGRAPSSAETSYWSQRVRQVGNLGALRDLYYTPEAVSLRIAANYDALLGREPSAGEISYWYPKEVESDINVAVLLASTPEYRNDAN